MQYDIEQSINKQAYQIPEYIDIIIKIGNMEFDRLRLISNFPIDDAVNFILDPKQTISKIKQEILDFL